jgi:membrane-anchored glycerophosphoryl diester phosphodiesterase (GDPDase)
MKRLGQIDQTITSVLVLFAVIFLLALFTYFTSSLRVVQDRTDIVFENHSVEKAAASSALLHSFLSDRFMFKGERGRMCLKV